MEVRGKKMTRTKTDALHSYMGKPASGITSFLFMAFIISSRLHILIERYVIHYAPGHSPGLVVHVGCCAELSES
jgi:hypothetical protein